MSQRRLVVAGGVRIVGNNWVVAGRADRRAVGDGPAGGDRHWLAWRVGSVSGLSDSVVGGAEFISVLLFQGLGSGSAVELFAEALILLHEAVQFLGQVVVLTSQHLCVVGKSILLAALLLLALLRVVVKSAQALHILLGVAQLTLGALESFLGL